MTVGDHGPFMGIEGSVQTLMAKGVINTVMRLIECEAEYINAWENDPGFMKFWADRGFVAREACERMGVRIFRNERRRIVGMILPRDPFVEYVLNSLKDIGHVSEPGVEDVKPHSFFDPSDAGLRTVRV
jgi:hypothetical protein